MRLTGKRDVTFALDMPSLPKSVLFCVNQQSHVLARRRGHAGHSMKDKPWSTYVSDMAKWGVTQRGGFFFA